MNKKVHLIKEKLHKNIHYIEELEKVFSRYPARKQVVLCLLKNGLRVGDKGKILCGDIEISPAKLSRNLKIDRRVINDTVKFVLFEPDLKNLFTKIKPMARIDEFARELGLGVIRIYVKNAKESGLIHKITGIVAEYNVSIKQLIAEDPELGYDPSLILVLEKELPRGLINELKGLGFITKIEVM